MNFVDCLPQEWAFLQNVKGIRELRLRNGCGARVNIDGNWFWLGNNVLLSSPTRALHLDVCEAFVKKACNQSVFAYEKMLAQGFFTLQDGSRIGVCGVMGSGGTFQKYTSLCVRTANYFACATQDFTDCVLVAGLPSSGKTTYLRDLACKLSQKFNVAVVDERGEISQCNGFEARSNCDVFLYANKRYAFEVAVRTMSPDWIVCDELSENDFPLLQNVTASGVKLAASVHAGSLNDLRQKLDKHLKCFRFVVLLERHTFKQQVLDLQNLRE